MSERYTQPGEPVPIGELIGSALAVLTEPRCICGHGFGYVERTGDCLVVRCDECHRFCCIVREEQP